MLLAFWQRLPTWDSKADPRLKRLPDASSFFIWRYSSTFIPRKDAPWLLTVHNRTTKAATGPVHTPRAPVLGLLCLWTMLDLGLLKCISNQRECALKDYLSRISTIFKSSSRDSCQAVCFPACPWRGGRTGEREWAAPHGRGEFSIRREPSQPKSLPKSLLPRGEKCGREFF